MGKLNETEIADYTNSATENIRRQLRDVEIASASVQYGKHYYLGEEKNIMRNAAVISAKQNLMDKLMQFAIVSDYNNVITAKIYLPYIRSAKLHSIEEQRDFWKNLYTDTADKLFEYKRENERLKKPWTKRILDVIDKICRVQ